MEYLERDTQNHVLCICPSFFIHCPTLLAIYFGIRFHVFSLMSGWGGLFAGTLLIRVNKEEVSVVVVINSTKENFFCCSSSHDLQTEVKTRVKQR